VMTHVQQTHISNDWPPVVPCNGSLSMHARLQSLGLHWMGHAGKYEGRGAVSCQAHHTVLCC
jgi:hypothetical protein